MKTNYIFIFIFFFLLCCGKNITDITGLYKNDDYSKSEQLLKSLKFDGLAVGSELDLKKDSSFVYSTCAIISNGRWTIKKDSLILIENEIRWRIDSLNKYSYEGKHPEIRKKLTFKINKDKLESIEIYKSPEGEIDKTYSRLVKFE
ncbi:hypothetical protein [Winogradskyella pacifica]|uniref:hypothetical protein n=1 Tax=Winogradskyella pacifica TaxID=664642 RepID=UPI0015CB63D3|nr:hypothetical protein [Winogradskyella pacifica]